MSVEVKYDDALAAPFADDIEDRAAKAVYDAIEPLSGDPIGVVIHMSDHLFWHDLPGSIDLESQLAAVRVICRVAAAAAIRSIDTGEG